MSPTKKTMLALCALFALTLTSCAAPLIAADTTPRVLEQSDDPPPTTAAFAGDKCEVTPPLPPEDKTPPTDTPGTAPSPAEAQIVSTITQQVQQVRGLDGADVPVEMLGADQVTATLDRFRTERDTSNAAGLDPLAKQLGWVPESSSLEAESKALQAGLVLGFYVPEAKKLWVVQRGDQLSPLQQATVAHEWTHALQDANYDLAAIDATVPKYDFDWSSAVTAVEEGDASHTEEEWSQAYQTPEQRRARQREEASVAPGQVELGPLVDDLYMPYVYGPAFISDVIASSGTPPLAKVFADMPRTTTEILHPELYAQGFERTEIGLDDYGARLGSGWEKKIAGTWGEFSTANILSGIPASSVTGGASDELPYVQGWLGDCLGFWMKDTGRFGAIHTKWTDEATAARFVARVGKVLDESGAQPAANGFRGVDPEHLWKVDQSGDTTTLLFTNESGATTAAGGSSRV
ncbi:MAG: hypothetical protein U0U69_05865 [Acidimicrobiia bacterium]